MAEWLGGGLLALGLGFALVCALYVGVTFAFAWRSTPLPLGRRLRVMARELWIVLLYQALQPLYYFVGKRLGGGDGRPVVLVHGYFQNRVAFLGLAKALRRAGLGPLFGFNYAWTAPTADNVEALARFIDAVLAEGRFDRVDLVAHSMGGLVALEYIADPQRRTRVHRVCTVATPHAGVQWRGPILGAASREIRASSAYLAERQRRAIELPCMSLFSPCDNVVFPASTSTLTLRGGQDFQTPPTGHFSILFEPVVHTQIAAFLAAPSDTQALPAAAAATAQELAASAHAPSDAAPAEP